MASLFCGGCLVICVYYVNASIHPLNYLQSLARLDLSHNPLGDGAIKHLSIMLPHLVSLTVLQLQCCHLTANCFKPECVLLNCKQKCLLS
jgi:hypothetical protein